MAEIFEPKPIETKGFEIDERILKLADKAEEIEYIYDGDSILIEDGKVTALAGGTSTTVTAKTAHHETTFNVKCEAVESRFTGDVEFFLNEQKARNVQPGVTLFAGDSFFDYRYFWTNFYGDIEGDTYITGIGATTIEGWMCYAERLIYDVKPANVVLHIGSNDFWDIHRNANQVYSSYKKFIEDIHANLPDAHIYYFGVENRTYSMPQYGGWDDPNALAISIEQLATFNKKAADYAAERDYLTFLDSPSYFTNEDGSCKSEMFKDGVHPNNEEYEFYVKALIEAGLDVKYTGSTKTLSDWTTAADSVWNTSLKTIYIPKAVIDGGTRVFYNCADLVIYCEVTEDECQLADGWNNNSSSTQATVKYGYTLEQYLAEVGG